LIEKDKKKLVSGQSASEINKQLYFDGIFIDFIEWKE